MKMHVRIAVAALAGAACAPALAQAQTPPNVTPTPIDRQARAWAATCAACHGTEGRPLAGFPLLAGRDPEQIVTALLDFREGRRPEATVMHQHAKGYTDDEIRRMARHFSTLPMEAPKGRR